MKGRFRSLDQTRAECGKNLVKILLQVQMLSPNSIEDHKKRSLPKFEGVLSSNSTEEPQKKVFTTI